MPIHSVCPKALSTPKTPLTKKRPPSSRVASLRLLRHSLALQQRHPALQHEPGGRGGQSNRNHKCTQFKTGNLGGFRHDVHRNLVAYSDQLRGSQPPNSFDQPNQIPLPLPSPFLSANSKRPENHLASGLHAYSDTAVYSSSYPLRQSQPPCCAVLLGITP